MPLNCIACPLSDKFYEWCNVTDKQVTEYVEYRPDWCPLFEISNDIRREICNES